MSTCPSACSATTRLAEKASDLCVNYLLDSHGWGLGEHNHWIKYTNWELDARIPLIIHAPHKPHTWGTRQSTALVEHVDLYPTISELAGIAVPGKAGNTEGIEGDSYAALFDMEHYAHYNDGTYHYRDGSGSGSGGGGGGGSLAASSSEQQQRRRRREQEEEEALLVAAAPQFAAAYTQYPRCNKGSMPIDILNNSRCASVKKADFKYMGYSVRTPTWRYTEFAEWNGLKLCPVWNASVPCAYSELYDHTGDDGYGLHVFDDFEVSDDPAASDANTPTHARTALHCTALHGTARHGTARHGHASEDGSFGTDTPRYAMLCYAMLCGAAMQNVNLAFKAEHAAVVKALSAQIRAFYKSERCP
jgi:hypothetical protein